VQINVIDLIYLVYVIYPLYVDVQATVRRYTTNVQHARMEQERRADFTRSDINRELMAERLRNANTASEERAAKRRVARMTAQQQREAAMEEAARQVVAAAETVCQVS